MFYQKRYPNFKVQVKHNEQHQLRSNNCKLYKNLKMISCKNRFHNEVPQHGTLCPVRLSIIMLTSQISKFQLQIISTTIRATADNTKRWVVRASWNVTTLYSVNLWILETGLSSCDLVKAVYCRVSPRTCVHVDV